MPDEVLVRKKEEGKKMAMSVRRWGVIAAPHLIHSSSRSDPGIYVYVEQVRIHPLHRMHGTQAWHGTEKESRSFL